MLGTIVCLFGEYPSCFIDADTNCNKSGCYHQRHRIKVQLCHPDDNSVKLVQIKCIWDLEYNGICTCALYHLFVCVVNA